MASKWSKMHPNPIFGRILAICSQYSSLFGPIKRSKEAKMGRIWAKKGFPRGLMQHVNAGKVHLCTSPARDSDFLFFIF